MPIIYLLRHAQSVANTKGILAGQDNSVELSKDGHKQAQLLAPYLSTIKMNRVYSSPLTRCIQTISPFMQLNPNLDFEIDGKKPSYSNVKGIVGNSMTVNVMRWIGERIQKESL